MNNKTLIYKPSVDYYHTSRKTNTKSETVSLKERVKIFLENLLILLLGISIFVLSVGIAYNTYILAKLKVKKLSLLKENKALRKEYQYLTSREVVLKKAKKLNLYPPQKGDLIKLK